MQSKAILEIRPDNLVLFRRRLTWFLLFRLFVATLFLGGTIVYQLRSGLLERPELPILYGMVALTYLQAGTSAFLLPKTNRLYLFTQAQFIWDLLLATFLIYLTGGVSSHFSFLYILIIFSASLFLRRRNILFVASASAILYGSLLDLQYYSHLPIISGLPYIEAVDGATVFYAISVNVFAFFLTAILCSILAENRWKSERALEKKAVDIEGLESLNQAILSSINSGLMLVNSAGHIRSFNKSAAHITGFSFHDVYDRDVRKLFPCFDLFEGIQFNQIARAQGVFQHRAGTALTLGYSTTQVTDNENRDLGLLVVFQDLTESIEMDRRLIRADQQAAVGRLASGMAHEIRNPLASISGSVQLLLEGVDVRDEDRRLMQIVVSEADRLSQLLTDFLSFAKPPKPVSEPLLIAELFDQVADLLQADHRFREVDIVREYSVEHEVFADQKQLQQVVLDLAINATEAMTGKGTLFLGFDSDTFSIYIEDTGVGIDDALTAKIFEPFFTTKDSGTGLGLATVHSIVVALGGYVDVVSGREGGAKFVITLPKQRQQDFVLFNPETEPSLSGLSDS